jgi:hypothetical protein
MNRLAELRTQAMLLGMWYDAEDHTFNKCFAIPSPKNEGVFAYGNEAGCLCADTLEPVGVIESNKRKVLVRKGKLGITWD